MAQLLSNLPVGAKVKFGKHRVNNETPWSIVWTIVAKNHSSTPAYPSDSVTLHSTSIVDLRAYDAREPNSISSAVDRANYGNNRYPVSNIHQWLNSRAGAGEWWVSAHTYDAAPTDDLVYRPTGYKDRPGFLNSFTEEEYNAILSTTIRVVNPSYDVNTTKEVPAISDISAKIFLPSMTEIGAGNMYGDDGTSWGYYTSATERACGIMREVIDNTLYSDKPSNSTTMWQYWLRTPRTSSLNEAQVIISSGGATSYLVFQGHTGVRPALNLASSLLVSDTVDGDGCYTFEWNSAPYAPNSITVPSVIYGGKTNVISWSTAVDPDGDAIDYQLECQVNDGEYSLLYRGKALSYSHILPFGTTKALYRVKSIDTHGVSSGYTTATIRRADNGSIINNTAPLISGADANLGVKSTGFTGTYSVNDANGNAVTVTEAIDGVPIRTLVATLGVEITYGVTANTWLALPNGSHTLTISATDGIDTSVRRYTFTKLVDSFTIQNSTPWESADMPSRIMLVVTRNIPPTATFKVEVCNNAHDASPTWENATDAVLSGLVHVFNNRTKTASKWGVKFRVTVNRNGATGACYISAIGGNYE